MRTTCIIPESHQPAPSCESFRMPTQTPNLVSTRIPYSRGGFSLLPCMPAGHGDCAARLPAGLPRTAGGQHAYARGGQVQAAARVPEAAQGAGRGRGPAALPGRQPAQERGGRKRRQADARAEKLRLRHGARAGGRGAGGQGQGGGREGGGEGGGRQGGQEEGAVAAHVLPGGGGRLGVHNGGGGGGLPVGSSGVLLVGWRFPSLLPIAALASKS